MSDCMTASFGFACGGQYCMDQGAATQYCFQDAVIEAIAAVFLEEENPMRTRTAVSTFAMLAGLACFGTLALAQAPNQAVTVKKIKDNIYLVEGGGGGSGIIIGQNGVIVVDAKTTP